MTKTNKIDGNYTQCFSFNICIDRNSKFNRNKVLTALNNFVKMEV